MALPTANLTVHADASTNADVWKFLQAGSPYHNTPGGDGDNIETWDDVEKGGDVAMFYGQASGPTYRVNTPLMALPCLDFNGTDEAMQFYNDAGSSIVGAEASALLQAAAYTAYFAIYVQSLTANPAAAYDSPAIFADTGGLIGLHLRDHGSSTTDGNGVSSRYKVIAYNWDGGEDKVELSISLNTSYVVRMMHSSGNLLLSVNGGANVSVASGNTAYFGTEALRVGVNYSNTAFAHFRIGEIAMYNAVLAGADLTDADAYFTRWTAAGGLSIPVAMRHYAQMRGA